MQIYCIKQQFLVSQTILPLPLKRLKQTYEAQPTHHLVLLVDLYAQYVLHCSSKGKKTFLNNTEFLSALKSVNPLSLIHTSNLLAYL